jgi:hypothetical protein
MNKPRYTVSIRIIKRRPDGSCSSRGWQKYEGDDNVEIAKDLANFFEEELKQDEMGW